jgi:hypothetical protein
MNGWIEFAASSVRFGFGAPADAGGPFVSFDVAPVGLWAQRRTPEPGSLVRKVGDPRFGDHWAEVAGPAGELGIYLGHGHVLTVSAAPAAGSET